MLALECVSKAFGANQVLKDLSLTIGPQEILCLLGPSGCGKTTLLNLAAGLLEPDAGRVSRPAGRPGIVFQEPRLLPWRTAEENLTLGLKPLRLPRLTVKQAGALYMARLGLQEAAHLFPHQLSAGMQQRVALGRALITGPSYLLLDEPFKSLDVALRLSLVRLLLDEWQRRPRPILFVTHDTAEAALAGHRILVVGSRPLAILKAVTPDRHPAERQPGDPDVLQTHASLYALLADLGDTGATAPRHPNGPPRHNDAPGWNEKGGA